MDKRQIITKTEHVFNLVQVSLKAGTLKNKYMGLVTFLLT